MEVVNDAIDVFDPSDYSILPLDEAYYLLHNADVASSGLSSRRHFGTNRY